VSGGCTQLERAALGCLIASHQEAHAPRSSSLEVVEVRHCGVAGSPGWAAFMSYNIVLECLMKIKMNKHTYGLGGAMPHRRPILATASSPPTPGPCRFRHYYLCVVIIDINT